MNELVSYYRDKKRNPRGAVVGLRTPDGRLVVGWSLCCKRDQFSKSKARVIAEGRALVGSTVAVPAPLVPLIEDMEVRVRKYFK